MADKNDVLISLNQDDFTKKVTPKPVSSPKDMFLFCCPDPCGNVHLRHAGYVQMLLPLVQADGQKRVAQDSYSVQVCTKCKKCFVWYDGQVYDITELIDLKAWEKTEKAMHAATGPGGDC